MFQMLFLSLFFLVYVIGGCGNWNQCECFFCVGFGVCFMQNIKFFFGVFEVGDELYYLIFFVGQVFFELFYFGGGGFKGRNVIVCSVEV